MSAASFSLEPAEAGDVDAIRQVCKAAFTNDTQTILKNMAKQSDNGTQPPIGDWIAGDRIKVIKAVDNATKEIIGVVCWRIRDKAAVDAFKAAAAEQSSTADQQDPEPETEPETTNPPKDAIDRLNDYTDQDFNEWMARIMKDDTMCAFICTIAVHPNHHRRGVGKALVRWGTDQADQLGIFSWMHSSEGGYPLMLSEQFVVDRELTVDLDRYAKDVELPEVRDRTWGTYTLRYMVRQPRKL